MSKKTFSTLKDAINSWYLNKDSPQVTVTRTDNTLVTGRLRVCAEPNISVQPEGLPKELHTIRVDNIQRVDLTWCEGEPPTIWKHRITSRPDGTWLFEEISKEQKSPPKP